MERVDEINHRLEELAERLNSEEITRDEFRNARRELIIEFSGADHKLPRKKGHTTSLVLLVIVVAVAAALYSLALR